MTNYSNLTYSSSSSFSPMSTIILDNESQIELSKSELDLIRRDMSMVSSSLEHMVGRNDSNKLFVPGYFLSFLGKIAGPLGSTTSSSNLSNDAFTFSPSSSDGKKIVSKKMKMIPAFKSLIVSAKLFFISFLSIFYFLALSVVEFVLGSIDLARRAVIRFFSFFTG